MLIRRCCCGRNLPPFDLLLRVCRRASRQIARGSDRAPKVSSTRRQRPAIPLCKENWGGSQQLPLSGSQLGCAPAASSPGIQLLPPEQRRNIICEPESTSSVLFLLIADNDRQIRYSLLRYSFPSVTVRKNRVGSSNFFRPELDGDYTARAGFQSGVDGGRGRLRIEFDREQFACTRKCDLGRFDY